MDALAKLGINGWMLVFQAVNFAILLFVLHRFVYGPMIRFLDERSAKIQKGVDDAQKAVKTLESASEKEAQILQEAQKEAKKLLEQAEIQSKKRTDAALALAQSQAEKLLSDARAQAVQDAQKLLADAKKDLTTLVLQAVEKVVHQKMDSTTDKVLVEKILS